MSIPLNLAGERFGRLVAVKVAGKDAHRSYLWSCICDCGSETIVPSSRLRRGGVKSCGCLRLDPKHLKPYVRMAKKHGAARAGKDGMTKEFVAWRGMKARCLTPTAGGYADYGGRGITVCDRWVNSFENFLIDMGHAPGPEYSIDRIDNFGNYEPGNVRWATDDQQRSNKRSTRWVAVHGERMILRDAINKFSPHPRGTVHARLSRGFSLADALGLSPDAIQGL
jgi:hypothetical protein